MSKKIEDILQKRLSSETSKDFDKSFWNKFENENEKKKNHWFPFSLSFFVPAAVAIVLLFIVSTQDQVSTIDQVVDQVQKEEAEILADLDQQDWEILLGEDFDS